MKSEALAGMPLQWMPILALFIFLAVFVGAFLWSIRPGSNKLYEDVANRALSDGEKIQGASNE